MSKIDVLKNRKVRREVNRLIEEEFTLEDIEGMEIIEHPHQEWSYLYIVQSKGGWELSFMLEFDSRDIIPWMLFNPEGDGCRFPCMIYSGYELFWWLKTLFNPLARYLYRCRKVAIRKNLAAIEKAERDKEERLRKIKEDEVLASARKDAKMLKVVSGNRVS